jgi:hypothetical protein
MPSLIKSELPGPINFNNQRGAALAVALVIVLLISVLGAATMKRGTMEEMMGAGHYHKQITFQASESAVESTISDVGLLQSARAAANATASQVVSVPFNGVSASVTFAFVGERPALGWSLDSTGGGASSFVITAVGEVLSTGTSTTTQHGVYRVNPPSGN